MPIPKSSSGEMPFLDHLEELRWRIIYSVIGMAIGVGIGLLIVFKFDLIALAQQPLAPYMHGRKLVVLHPLDPFSIHLQIGIYLGLVLSAPVVGYQIWAFLSPALQKAEKRIVIPVLAAATVLFGIGVAMAWYIVLPMTLKWMYGLIGDSLDPMYSASDYFGFVTNLLLAFGLCFELPLLLVALSAFGIVSAKALSNGRRFAVVIIWAGASIISPGDVVTVTIALAVPLYLLYELSVVVAYAIERKRRVKRAKEDEL